MRKGLVRKACLPQTSIMRPSTAPPLHATVSTSGVRARSGGPKDHEPNFPLRGHKGSDLEGGTRVVAFVGGGFLPGGLRGGRVGGMMHICDWRAQHSTA